jgi:hypothetical protein
MVVPLIYSQPNGLPNCRNIGLGTQFSVGLPACGYEGSNRVGRTDAGTMPEKTIQRVFLFIFVLTAIVTLLGITEFVRIRDVYLWALFTALLLELIAVVIATAKKAFGTAVEHYKWQIVYPTDLRQHFEKLYLPTPNFAAFYERNKGKEQSAIQDDAISTIEQKNFLDQLFVIKKAGEFAGNSADGQMFLIRAHKGTKDYGIAVLTFPDETQPVAFQVTSDPELDRHWHVRFRQPERFVEYEGLRNKWKGGDLEVDFTHLKDGEEWEGELRFEGVYVGKFSLNRQLA